MTRKTDGPQAWPPDAYGDTTEVPRLLRVLADQPDEREVALADLADRIAHQGTAEEVAAEVVPALWQLVAATDGDDRAGALLLLGDLAAGGSHRHLLGTRSFDEAPVGLLSAVPHLRERVCAGAAACVPWLGDSDPEVRAAAGFVLAMTGTTSASGQVAAAAATEVEPVAGGDLWIAAGWLLGRTGPTGGALPPAPTDAPPILSAGHALARAYADPIDEAATWALYELLSEPQRATDSLWADGDHTAHAVALLARHAERSGNLSILTDALDLAPESFVPTLACSMLRLAFDDALLEDRELSAPPPRAGLSESQFDVLRLLQSRDDVWCTDLRGTLRALGMIASPSGLRRYLGVTGAPTVLDRMIEVDASRQRLGRHWQMACLRKSRSGPALAAAIAEQLTADEAVEAVVLGGRAEVASPYKGYELELLILHAVSPTGRAAIHRKLRWWYGMGNPDYINAGGFTVSGENILTAFWLALWRTRTTPDHDKFLRRVRPSVRVLDLLAEARLIDEELRRCAAEAKLWRYPDGARF